MVDQNHTQRLRVSNIYSEPITLCLEPWGDEISIPSNVSFEIVAEGPKGDHLEVTYEERRVSVYGWSGLILSVFHNGERLVECAIPAPRTPPLSLPTPD
jgi:hypothetical protein